MTRTIENKMVPMACGMNVMRFLVYIPDKEKPLRVQVERHKSGASKYGNETAVTVYVNDDWYMGFDTRYDSRMDTVDGYREAFTEWVVDQWEHDGQEVVQIL